MKAMAMLRIVVFFAGLGLIQAAGCPHEEEGLRKWSDSSSWPGGKIPADGSDVVISDGVLLDQTTARLNTITIESTGKLVWSPEGNFDLTVSYIAVSGRFDIGSEKCKFDAFANIILTGDIDTAPSIPGDDTQKVIAILQGGTLEIHGKRKLSWTKLVKTVPKAGADGIISDFNTDNDCSPGLYVFEFDVSTGTMINFKRHVTKTKSNKKVAPGFESHLDEIQDGTMVMIAACKVIYGDFIDTTPVYESIERLLYGSVTGNAKIRQAEPLSAESYAAFTIKGSFSESVEVFTPVRPGNSAQHSVISKTFWDLGYKVIVESYVNSKDYIDVRTRSLETAYPIIDLLEDASTWLPGDRIFLASTDYKDEQAEVATIITCTTCSPTQIRIDLEPKFMHWGKTVQGVDERGEVGLLTRYIRIEGEMQDTCPPANGNCEEFNYDTFGGHIKIFPQVDGAGFKDVHIEGVELYHMGQQTDLGRYPIHFHMCLDVDDKEMYPNPPYVRDSSVYQSFSRCITIHGTSGVELIDNVAFDILGHCYFLEDGGEQRNVLDGNLGAGIKHGSLLPFTDSEEFVSVFWITNPKNILRNNAAAGSLGYGIWYVYPEEPIGPSKGLGMMQRHEARRTPIWEFTNNVAHSNFKSGLWIDNELYENGDFDKSNHYSPRVDPLSEDSEPVSAYLHRITAYKNRHANSWVRGGRWYVTESSFADSLECFAFAGHDEQVQFINTSIIVGETANIGEPTVKSGVEYDRAVPKEGNINHPMFGYRQYDGPVIVYDCWFNNFVTNSYRAAGAYGFTKTMGHPTSPVQPTFNLKYGFDDGFETGNRIYEGTFEEEHFSDEEGDWTPTIRDIDGSLTGTEYSTVVRTVPFHLTDKCYTRENWQISACPYRYGKIFLWLETNSEFPTADEWNNLNPFMMRDDIPDVKEFHLTDPPKMGYSVILEEDYSYTLHWEKKIHPYMKFQGAAAERDYNVRVGVCIPRDATFDLKRGGSFSLKDLSYWEEATSVEEVDADTTGKKYFWDSEVGLLFFKFIHSAPIDPYYERCPDLKCDNVHLKILSGTLTDADCSNRAYGPYKKQIQDSKPVMKPDDLGMTSAEPPPNYGAGETRPFATRTPVDGKFGYWGDWEQCSVTCGGGIQVKRRMCDKPMPEHGGKNCDESFDARYRTRECNKQAC